VELTGKLSGAGLLEKATVYASDVDYAIRILSGTVEQAQDISSTRFISA
jgi:hypothetical protein